MISLEFQILIAVVLDLIIGDPVYSLHPVRLIGRMAGFLEKKLLKQQHSSEQNFIRGVLYWMIIIFSAGV